MKDIYTQLTESMESIGGRLDSLDTRLDHLIHLMADMVKMEKTIQDLETKIDHRIGRLMDQVVEMAMVQTGDADAAVRHRAQARLDKTLFSDPVSWDAQDTPGMEDGQWPPEGCDSMELKG
jgi:hypothetical protein